MMGYVSPSDRSIRNSAPCNNLMPIIDQLFRANQFELLAKTLMAEGNDRVMRLIGNTAHGVGDHNHPVSSIHGAQ